MDLKLNKKIVKIGVYIISAILISFWKIKICVYNMRQNQETYMIASLWSRRYKSYMM